MSHGLRLSAVAVILALGMILSAVMVSKLIVRVRHEQAITVKGYAEQDVVADIGKFTCCCSMRGASLQEAHAKLQAGRDRVLAYLQQKQFPAAGISAKTIQLVKVVKRDAKGKETNEIEYYDLSQWIAVTSSNVAAIRDVSIAISDLIKEGIDLSVTPPEFYVSTLPATKLELLAKATDDAYRRAVVLAENSRGRVGALIAAQQGVLQITERHSTDTSGCGMYDTATIEKTAKAVVTLEYAIEPVR